MENPATNREMIQTRGRLYSENPSYSMCILDKKGSAFKTLVGLADEAAIAKARLAQTLQAGHPLSSILTGMSCAEAISSLLAYTAAYKSTSSLVNVSNSVAQSSVHPGQRPARTSEQIEFKPMGSVSQAVNDVLGLDDESFEAFASFPGATG